MYKKFSLSAISIAVLFSTSCYATSFNNQSGVDLQASSATKSGALILIPQGKTISITGDQWGDDHNTYISFNTPGVCQNLIDKGLIKWGTRYPVGYAVTIHSDLSCDMGDHPTPPKPTTFDATIQAKSDAPELNNQVVKASLAQESKQLSEQLKVNAGPIKLTGLKGAYTVSAPDITYSGNTYTASLSTATLDKSHTSEVITYTKKQPTPPPGPGPVFPKLANSAWVYDNSSYPQKPGASDLGSLAITINQINEGMGNKFGFNEIYPYGGDIELIGDLDNWTPCKKTEGCHIYVYFDSSKYGKTASYDGKQHTDKYAQRLQSDKKIKHIVPVIDGRINDLGVSSSYDNIFNIMDEAFANKVADEVADQVCADPNVDGIQFDIEPFNIPADSKNGQYYFYKRIAEDFVGSNCIDKAHPKGRFFSVFTFAKNINKNMAEVFNAHDNGYVVDSLYDLGPDSDERAGQLSTTPDNYKQYASKEITDLMNAANQYKMHFQIGVPGVASVHEFAYYENADASGKPDGKPVYPAHAKGQSNPTTQDVYQADYLYKLLSATQYQDLMKNQYYVGTGIWALDKVMPWMPKVDGKKVQRYYFPDQMPTHTQDPSDKHHRFEALQMLLSLDLKGNQCNTQCASSPDFCGDQYYIVDQHDNCLQFQGTQDIVNFYVNDGNQGAPIKVQAGTCVEAGYTHKTRDTGPNAPYVTCGTGKVGMFTKG